MGGIGMENNRKPFDLEERLVEFACMALSISEMLPRTKGGVNLEHQLSKSGTSAALNYGEAQSAESPDDFIHKIKIVLKELHETRVCFKIIKMKYLENSDELIKALNECYQLIAIFLKSLETAKKNKADKKTSR
jgi:four helix bundle protein